MHNTEPARIARLLEQLLATRDLRDAEPRWSGRWYALDFEMHRIERAVFREPEPDAPDPACAAGANRRMDRAG